MAAPVAGGWAGAVMSKAGAVMSWAGAIMSWARAVMILARAVKAVRILKVKVEPTDRQTDRQTDQQTQCVIGRVARDKNGIKHYTKRNKNSNFHTVDIRR